MTTGKTPARSCFRPSPGVAVLLMAMAVLLGATLFIPCESALSSPYGDRRGVNYDWQWRSGRASWFGTGSWSIHNGSCAYHYIHPDEPVGWDVVALADVDPEYAGSCGLCYEVKCDPTWTSDFYGESFDRTSACYDPSASLVIRVVDVCPCEYPSNAYSNMRWCCGDRGAGAGHMDMSLWAFEKLAELRWGVIPLRYRPVPCDYQPDRVARPIDNPSPGVPPPAGMDSRALPARPGAPTLPFSSSTVTLIVSPSHADDVRVARDWPEMRADGSNTQLSLFEDGYAKGIRDASWSTELQSLADSTRSGALGSQALCGKVYMGGALAFRGWNGMFVNHTSVEFWFYVGYTGWDGVDQKTPDLWVSVSGDKGGCRPSRVIDSKPFYMEPTWIPHSTTYFWGWQIYLPIFNGVKEGTVINKPSDFQGCGGNGVWDLHTLEFRNDGWADQWFCIDRVRLV